MLNTRSGLDTRQVLSGKDGALYNADGTMLATVESYQTQINFTNGKYQPLGDAQEHEVVQSFAVTLTFTEAVIEDGQLIQDVFDFMTTGIHPEWTFQGVLHGRNGSEQRINYRSCVPSGTIDLQNVAVGDTIKRQWSMAVNEPPELQKLLRA